MEVNKKNQSWFGEKRYDFGIALLIVIQSVLALCFVMPIVLFVLYCALKFAVGLLESIALCLYIVLTM
jgi:hypothetical protein